MACGAGANTVYLARKFQHIRFIGADLDNDLTAQGNRYVEENNITNCSFEVQNWYEIAPSHRNKHDGIVSHQALSWLSDWKKAIISLTELNPRWIAISSLFYEGDIEYECKLKDFYRNDGDGSEYQEMYYNIYSLKRVRKLFKEYGYTKFKAIPYEIDIDLERPDGLDIGTYTVKTEEGKRLQISGAMLMPRYFIVAAKDDYIPGS